MGYSTVRGDHIEYRLWLIFSFEGSVRLSRAMPKLARDERAINCKAIIPQSLFRTPQLQATLTVADNAPTKHEINVVAASEALRQALGVDIDLRIVEPV